MASKEEIKNLVTKVSLDQTGFQNGVSGINRSLAVVRSEFQAAAANVKNFGTENDLLKTKFDSLNKEIDLQKQKVNVLETAWKKSAETKGADAKATQDLEIKMNKAKASLANMEGELKRTDQALQENTNQSNKFGAASEKLGVNLGTLKTAFGAVGIAAGAYLKGAVDSAIKGEESTTRLTILLKNQNMTVAEAKKGIAEFTGAITKMSSFSGGEAKEALQALLQKGLDLGEALKMEGTLANVAAGMNISLADAANILVDAYNGKTRALQQLGILSKDEAKSLKDTENATISMTTVQERLNDRFGGAAQAQLKTYAGEMKATNNQFNAAKAAIGNALLPILTLLATKLADLLTPIAGFVKANPQFTASVLAIVAIFGTLIGGLSALQSIIGVVQFAIVPLNAALAGTGIAVNAALWPILAVIAAIAALAAAAYLIYKNWDLIKTKTLELWNYICGVFSNMVNFIKQHMDLIIAVVLGPIGILVALVINNWDAIKQATFNVWNGIVSFFTVTIPNAFNAFVQFFADLPAKVQTFLTDLFLVKIPYAVGYGMKVMINAVSTGIPAMIQFFIDMPGKIQTALFDILTKIGLWGFNLALKAKEIGSNTINNIVSFFRELPGKITEFTTSALNAYIQFELNIIQRALQTGKGILDSIVSFLVNLPTNVENFFVATVTKIIDFAGKAKDAAVNFGKSIYDCIVDAVMALPKKIEEILNTITDKVKSAVSWVGDKVGSMTSNFTSGFSDAGNKGKLPSYDVGTRFVPEDQIALIHKGEAIIPAEYNKPNYGKGGFTQNITINSPKYLSPAEIARQSKNSLRQLALSF